MSHYDSAYSRFCGTVKAGNRKLTIRRDHLHLEGDLHHVKWGVAGAVHVVRSSSIFTPVEKAGDHLRGRAKRVVILAPSADSPMFVMELTLRSMRTHSGLLAVPPELPTDHRPTSQGHL